MEQILFISGSNRKDSINFQLILMLKELIPEINSKILDLRTLPLPLYNQDDEINGIPDNAILLRKEFDAHDTIFMAIPEYNGSMPAFFKNAIDWLSRVEAPDYKYFRGKKLYLLNATPGFGGKYVLRHMEDIARKLGAESIKTMQFQHFQNHITFNDELQKPVMKKESINLFLEFLRIP